MAAARRSEGRARGAPPAIVCPREVARVSTSHSPIRYKNTTVNSSAIELACARCALSVVSFSVLQLVRNCAIRAPSPARTYTPERQRPDCQKDIRALFLNIISPHRPPLQKHASSTATIGVENRRLFTSRNASLHLLKRVETFNTRLFANKLNLTASRALALHPCSC